MKRRIETVISEAISNVLNEVVTLNGESSNIENVIVALQNIYNRILQQGVSSHEVTVYKIAQMIEDLKKINKRWKNTTMW